MPLVMNGVFVDKAGLKRKACRLIQVNLVNSRQIDLIYLACIRALIEFWLILRWWSGKREPGRNLSKLECDLL